MNSPYYVFMKLLPKNLASRVFGSVVNLKVPVFSRLAKVLFARAYKLNMAEASKPLSDYANIGELFIRTLCPGRRPIADSEVVCPVDGKVSQAGPLAGEKLELIQTKGKSYSLKDLLRDEALASKFVGGSFATIYLAPFNYHRIHSPVSGKLISASYIPGKLWPVNPWSVERVEGLFAINERIITRILLSAGGEMLLVKVGATNVGRIAVNYAPGWITNMGKLSRKSPRLDYVPQSEFLFEKGGELGRFEMGSTVILVADKNVCIRHPDLFLSRLGTSIRVGEALC